MRPRDRRDRSPRAARRCSAPRAPSAAITAQATSMKSARATISSLVTACTTGIAGAWAGRAFTVGWSTLPLRGSGRGGVETVADGDAPPVGPLGGTQPALPGRLDQGDADRTTPAGDQQPDVVH